MHSGAYKIPVLDFEDVSSWFFTVNVQELTENLRGPTLIKVKGRERTKVVVSCLLHGNEHTGFLAIQRFLLPYQDSAKILTKDLLILVGNVEAAALRLRHLDSQVDFNRIWSREECSGSEPWTDQVFQQIEASPTFAIVDIHNNTGLNPHYGCISSLGSEHLHLASLFGRTTVFFTRPKGAFSLEFSKEYPSITLECGLSGVETGVKHAVEFLDAVFRLDHFPESLVHPQDLDLFEIFATLSVKPGVRLSFNDTEDAELVLREDLDQLNFRSLEEGERIAKYAGEESCEIPFELIDSNGEFLEVHEFFMFEKHELFLKKNVVPAMLTKDIKVIASDCLGYLMRHKPFNDRAHE